MKKIITLICCVVSATAFSQIRISQIYPGGGNTGATYKQDFIEIFNGNTSSVTLTDWAVQYAPATGPGGNGDWEVAVIPSGTVLEAGKYYLIGLSTGATGAALPAPDAVNTGINLSATAGKVALTVSSLPLNGTNGCFTNGVVDAVGYGTTASCAQTSPISVTGLDNTKAFLRGDGGCRNDNNNSTEFTVGTVTPRNSASVASICVPQPIFQVSWLTGLTTTAGIASASFPFSVSGAGLTPATGMVTASVAGTDFQVSLNSTTDFGSSVTIPYTSGTITNANVFLRVSASAPLGSVNALITVSGGGASDATFTTVGNVLLAEPTLQATNITATHITDTSVDISWTNGNGAARLVEITPASLPQQSPVDAYTYTALPDIRTAGTIEAQNYVVFDGAGNGPVTIKGLDAGTIYEVRVYERNGNGATVNYLTSVTQTNPILVTTTGTSNTLTIINFTSLATPQFTGTGFNTRLPTMFYARVSKLSPNTTYRYFAQAAISTDLGTASSGAGSAILIDYTVSPVTFTYSSEPSLNSAGGYGKFKTDGAGNFTGFFGFVNTGNERFDPGSIVIPSLTLAIDQPTIKLSRLALDAAINVIGFTNTSFQSRYGSFIQGKSFALPGNIVALWNNISPGERPLSMAIVEKPAIVTGNGGTAWHSNFIPGYDSSNGSWNTVIPYSNPKGVRLIQTFDILSGDVLGCATDLDGVWPTGTVFTSDPVNGATPITISATDAPLNAGSSCFDILPVRFEYLKGGKTTGGIALNWKITCLSTSVTMEIQRSPDARNFTSLNSITATQARCNQPFDFTDDQPLPGKNYYRLKMIDIDGKVSYSPVVLVTNVIKGTVFTGLYPSVVKNLTSLGVLSEKATTIETRITDMSGRLMKSYKQPISSGSSSIKIDCSALAAGVYNLTGIAEDASVKTIRFIKQ